MVVRLRSCSTRPEVRSAPLTATESSGLVRFSSRSVCCLLAPLSASYVSLYFRCKTAIHCSAKPNGVPKRCVSDGLGHTFSTTPPCCRLRLKMILVRPYLSHACFENRVSSLASVPQRRQRPKKSCKTPKGPQRMPNVVLCPVFVQWHRF
jgi:hypothetical protein